MQSIFSIVWVSMHAGHITQDLHTQGRLKTSILVLFNGFRNAPLYVAALIASRHCWGFCQNFIENALPTVHLQCKVLYVGKYSNPSFGPFPQVRSSIIRF